MPRIVSKERTYVPLKEVEMETQYVKENPILAPDNDFLELVHVGETKTGIGSNKFYRMRNNHNGTFTATYGRVGATKGQWAPRSYDWPINMWQSKFYEKAQLHGYLLIKSGIQKKSSLIKPESAQADSKYARIRNKSVREIVDRLLCFANKTIAENYEVKAEAVSQRQIDLAEESIKKLKYFAENGLCDAFNIELMNLYSAIPRKMDMVSRHKATGQDSMYSILAKEMNLLDVMKGQVKASSLTEEQGKLGEAKTKRKRSIVTASGLEWRDCTDEEIQNIKKHLGSDASRFKKAWRVVNKKQEAAFRQFVNKNGIREGGIKFLYHGSRNENFWSIITNGLKLRPQGVHITGKMFGFGLYFAPSANKSLGYTSTQGSRWANGNSESGFLAVYKVATGKPYDVHAYSAHGSMDYDELQRRCPGSHCLWAHAGSMLRADEVIIYKEDQCTLRYLVELS